MYVWLLTTVGRGLHVCSGCHLRMMWADSMMAEACGSYIIIGKLSGGTCRRSHHCITLHILRRNVRLPSGCCHHGHLVLWWGNGWWSRRPMRLRLDHHHIHSIRFHRRKGGGQIFELLRRLLSGLHGYFFCCYLLDLLGLNVKGLSDSG